MTALQEVLGTNVALDIVKSDTSMLRTGESTIRQAMPLLESILGQHSAKLVVSRHPQVLRARAAIIQRTWRALVKRENGENGAKDAAERNPHLLASSSWLPQ